MIVGSVLEVSYPTTSPTVVQRVVNQPVRRTGISKPATCCTFRHSVATHLLEDSHDIRTVQELLRYRDVSTTMIYTHVLKCGPAAVRSPSNRMAECDPGASCRETDR